MSEYQYYEFRAIDRPLSQPEMRELRALSTRAQISSTSFVNFYNFGDFRGSPERLMEKYFDAFLYYANWGTRRLMFRFPRRLVDAETVSLYCDSHSASHRLTEEAVILEFVFSDENGGYWEEDEDEETLGSLIPVRAELLAGDLRALYLGWLLAVQLGDFEDDEDAANQVAASAFGRAAPGVFQRLIEVWLGCLQRRHESEDQAGQQGDASGEGEYPAIERRLADARQIFRC